MDLTERNLKKLALRHIKLRHGKELLKRCKRYWSLEAVRTKLEYLNFKTGGKDQITTQLIKLMRKKCYPLPISKQRVSDNQNK